jgi:hypothetical protein
VAFTTGGEDPALTDRTGCTSQEDRLRDSQGGKGCSSKGGIVLYTGKKVWDAP